MVRMYLFPAPKVLHGSNRSMWICWFGIEHCGSGCSSKVFSNLALLDTWHLRHPDICFFKSLFMSGQKFHSIILSLHFLTSSWHTMRFPCAEVINSCRYTYGTYSTNLLFFWSIVCCFWWPHLLQISQISCTSLALGIYTSISFLVPPWWVCIVCLLFGFPPNLRQ